MFKTSFLIATVAIFGLSACVNGDLERGLVGAAAGAVVADAVGGNATTGALIGGAAGVLCDDANVAGCR